ncbi:lamin-like protein [Helianthus annuus]|uniref:lamin-like protein n=1 Tax=Helianthus annuus TaxID=4232 RepID=UPI000B906BAF|nr:lamin-like protein [Helianthus annuus]
MRRLGGVVWLNTTVAVVATAAMLTNFVYDKHLFNVLEVNETSYSNSTDQGFIFNITRGAGRDVFELTQPKPYYFLASGGYCYNGMKVAVNVVEFVPAPQPSPATSGVKVCKKYLTSGGNIAEYNKS